MNRAAAVVCGWQLAVVLLIRIEEFILNHLGVFRIEEGALDPKSLTREQRLDHLANDFVATPSVEEATTAAGARSDPLTPPSRAATRLADVNHVR
jgi:hypothetical protein